MTFGDDGGESYAARRYLRLPTHVRAEIDRRACPGPDHEQHVFPPTT